MNHNYNYCSLPNSCKPPFLVVDREKQTMRLLARCCLAAALFAMAIGAKQKKGDTADWIAELRSIPKPTADATGKIKTYSKHFVRSDPNTGAYTRLSYNCTYSDDLFVNLDAFDITNVTCAPDKLTIQTATLQALQELRHALAHAHYRLLYGGRWNCPDEESKVPEPIYRCA